MQYQVKATHKAITVFATATADTEEQAVATASKALLRPFYRKYPELRGQTIAEINPEIVVTPIPEPEPE